MEIQTFVVLVALMVILGITIFAIHRARVRHTPQTGGGATGTGAQGNPPAHHDDEEVDHHDETPANKMVSAITTAGLIAMGLQLIPFFWQRNIWVGIVTLLAFIVLEVSLWWYVKHEGTGATGPKAVYSWLGQVTLYAVNLWSNHGYEFMGWTMRVVGTILTSFAYPFLIINLTLLGDSVTGRGSLSPVEQVVFGTPTPVDPTKVCWVISFDPEGSDVITKKASLDWVKGDGSFQFSYNTEAPNRITVKWENGEGTVRGKTAEGRPFNGTFKIKGTLVEKDSLTIQGPESFSAITKVMNTEMTDTKDGEVSRVYYHRSLIPIFGGM